LIYIGTVNITLPDNLDLSTKDLTTALATQLYDIGKLTLGQAAHLAGYSKSTFMELLTIYKVSVFNYPAEDLEQDFENAKNYYS
jgi:predicted HTH domain antitoxin